MKKIVFATNNQHKLDEVKKITEGLTEIVSLSEINCFDDIPETADTLEGNALQKARYVKEKFGFDCFADDTGLEVEALDNAPGVYSARYAGEPTNSVNNMEKVLHEMEGISNRTAQFRTVIAFIEKDEIQLFEGIVKGKIAEKPEGNGGFGYDPVFIPEGYEHSFATLSPEMKNSISHRARAVAKLSAYLSDVAQKPNK